MGLINFSPKKSQILVSLQIHVSQLQTLQALIDGAFDVSPTVLDLCRDEELLSGHTALLDRNPQFRFGSVRISAVKVNEAFGDSRLQDFDESGVEWGTLSVILVSGSPSAKSNLKAQAIPTRWKFIAKWIIWNVGHAPLEYCCHRSKTGLVLP